jgi:hypothetical protein
MRTNEGTNALNETCNEYTSIMILHCPPTIGATDMHWMLNRNQPRKQKPMRHRRTIHVYSHENSKKSASVCSSLGAISLRMGNFHMKRMMCTPRQQHSSPIVNTAAVRHETAREVSSCCYLYHHKKKLVLFSSPPQFPPHRNLEQQVLLPPPVIFLSCYHQPSFILCRRLQVAAIAIVERHRKIY